MSFQPRIFIKTIPRTTVSKMRTVKNIPASLTIRFAWAEPCCISFPGSCSSSSAAGCPNFWEIQFGLYLSLFLP